MQWIVLVLGLLALLLLAFTARRPAPAPRREAPLDDELPAYLARVAARGGARGRARPRLARNALGALERDVGLLSRAPEDELLPAAKWLADNGRFLQEEIASLRVQLPGLPPLPRAQGGEPRAALFAAELCAHTNAQLTADGLTRAVAAWQRSAAFTVDELNALPACLRLALVRIALEMSALCADDQRAQHASARFWDALARGRERRAQRLFKRWERSGAFLERLLSACREQPEGDRALWLERYFAERGLTAEQLRGAECERQTDNALWTSAAITSLRAVAKLPWDRLLEDMSLVHQALREDETYRRMDMESRAYYRGRVAVLARMSQKPELSVCAAAQSLVVGAKGVKAHVGYYLMDEGQDALLLYLQALGVRNSFKRFCAARACGLCRLGAWLCFAGLVAAAYAARVHPAVWLPFGVTFLCALEGLAVRLAGARLHPRLAPRIRVDRLTDDARTLVVCPTMLLSAEHALQMVKHLSVLYHANPDERLDFMLLGDFQDSLTGTLSADDEIMLTASAAVKALAEDTGHAFLYLQRQRVFHPRDHAYMSRERKRGGVETLLKLICSRPIEDGFAYASVPPESLAGRYRYVITLDSDTFLPPGAALRLVGAMLHPLRQRREEDGETRGVSVVQPRMEVAAHKVDTLLSLLLGGRGGTDPYNALIADFHADACGQGDYVGKAIIDPQAFLDATEGKILPGCVLSHDLLEGELAGCALASDIALYEGHPATLAGFCRRLHRWTRGDWQLLPYLLPVFPKPLRAPRGTLDGASKRKLWHNLLRSLAKPLRLVLLAYAAGTGKAWLFWLALLLPECAATIGGGRARWAALACRLAALPAEAVTVADAIARALYRLIVSRQRLLQWTTMAQLQKPTVKAPMRYFYISMASGGALAALALLPGAATVSALIVAALWVSFPFWLPYLEQSYHRSERPTEYMREVLKRLAESTLLFFDTVLEDNGLPPDNVQLEPNKGVSHRTSPTNVGLYLLSLLAFERLRLLAPDAMAERMARTVETLEKLPKWNGLPYNWYDTRTLEALKPAVVSSVDSGNLAACLLCCAQGARVLMRELPSRFRDLPGRLDALAEGMRLDALFDADAELFCVSADPETGARSAERYDLLASEARTLSYVAIMLGQAPVKHWYRLGRARTRTRRGQTLVSYSGTMFEYMMPLLLQPALRGTLLWDAAREALREQKRRRFGGAFGMSESGYYAFDPNLYYQYRAFGVASLALDATRNEDVIAPYATLLALPVDLRAAFANLLRLKALGLEGPLGLFEAADFDRSRIGDRLHYRVVRSHMAHHQGMIACAACNALCDGYLQALFSGLPRAEAHRLLLEEKPTRSRSIIARPLKRRRDEPSISPYRAAREARALRFPMDAHVLHGAGTTLVADTQGGGYMSRDGYMLTRFNPSCQAACGIRFYLRDSASGTYRRLADPAVGGAVSFETAQAAYRAERNGVEAALRCFVNPLDGAAIHLVELKNLEKAERMLEVCSYFEPSLAPQRDDEAHPAFQSLFLESEKLERGGVRVRRRAREENEQPRELWHALCSDAKLMVLRAVCDRAAFLGRGRTIYAPRAMEQPIGSIADSLGATIDPCVSLRAQFVLPAGGRARFAFITLMPGAQDAPAAFLERYANPESAARCFEPALTQGLVTARYLGLRPEEQNAASRLVGSLVYIGQPSQSRYAADNALPLRELWTMGLGGDLPVWTVVCHTESEQAFVKLALKAHALYRMSGLWTDLVLLLEPEAGRERPLADVAREWASAGNAGALVGQTGGVHLLEGLDEPKRALLLAASRAVFFADGKSLTEQLADGDAGEDGPNDAPAYAARPSSSWRMALPDAEKLLFDNGFGGFAQDGGSYVITLPPGRQTPAPWCNPLCSERFGTLAGESGLLFTYVNNSHSKRLTSWPNDPVSPRGEEAFYLRDEDNRLLWSPTRAPLGLALPARITHAPGETTYETSGYGIYSRVCCFADASAPLGVRVTTLRNEDENERVLSFFHVCGFSVGLPAAGWQLAHAEREGGKIYVTSPQLEGVSCLGGVDPEPTLLTTMSQGAFAGLAGDAPDALLRGADPAPRPGNVAALCFRLRLKPGESRAITTVIGHGESKAALLASIESLRADGATFRLHQVRQSWERRLGVMRFDLPDKALELMLGRWLPYQIAASRLWMRAGFYQAGGAYGFRDQLQDMLSQAYLDPDAARAHILACAAHQFEEGDVQHWWHPPRYGVRTRVSDDLLFLPYVAAEYVRITGDTGALAEVVPYLHAEPLRDGERERLDEPEVSPVAEPLWQHCLRAIDRVPCGAHGLPLMGGGDWNDGMNLVGGADGESVWLGMFLCETLRRFAPFTEPRTARRLLDRRHKLMQALERYGWDGAWYLRAWYSTSEKLGSSASEECRLDVLPQCWAVLCGLARDRGALAMDCVWRTLYERDAGVLKLLWPPFDGAEKPGYIAGYLPGVRENGGQYTHAVPWAIAAYHQLGSDERAWELVSAALPVNRAATKQLALRYRVEPYALAADIYANPQQRGRGGWTWYTGSASWLWVVMLEQLFGFQKIGSTLRFRPVAPPGWDGFSLSYRYGSATYHLHASRDCPFPTADGERLPQGRLVLVDDGRIHEATFPLRG